MSDLQKSLRIRESLLPPASDVIKRLGPGAVAASYIQLLDAEYDTGEDGDELMAKFINTLQDSGEKTSTYLHRLQAVLNQALSNHSMKSLNNLLDIEGANGQAVPYLGYVEVNFTFPEDFLGAEMEVPTLALVVPDMCNVSQILIGTNTLDVLYTLSLQEKGVCKPSSHGYQAVMKILEARRKHTDTGALGWVKMQGSNPEVIPAGHTVVIDVFIHVNRAITERKSHHKRKEKEGPYFHPHLCANKHSMPLLENSLLLRCWVLRILNFRMSCIPTPAPLGSVQHYTKNRRDDHESLLSQAEV
ncbi:hypothetical protein AAFF_G00147830 [Aldrovandia affinis]|uniref:Paraneoplastic antigen Ma-like C-terminal domain-containing protein n=1 Tax=Aldrovandia affinis TaxID=143900 RepID=A0AAD7RPP3_9TELE|nr:hypothetical protein AAFF_G00147830 [Aldrovandia affinis]